MLKTTSALYNSDASSYCYGIYEIASNRIEGKDDASDMVRILVNARIDVNAQDKKGKTALYLAAARWVPVMVENLLRYGADINISSNSGMSPLHEVARQCGYFETDGLLAYRDAEGVVRLTDAPRTKKMIQLFSDYKARLYVKNKYNYTPLHYAVGNPWMVDFLLWQGLNPNAEDHGGQMPLHHAVGPYNRGGDLMIGVVVELLAEKGAYIHARDKKGWTPLHYACSGNLVESVKVLLRYGADMYVETSHENWTALQIAEMSKAWEVASLLRQMGVRY